MRHNNKFNKLGRTASHRKALLSNMANSLIMHKRITTTLAKAKALRVYVEPIINATKEDTTHSRRMAFDKLQNKYVVTELYGVVAPKVAERPGGYCRILRLGRRQGDDAMMAIIELVDFNEDRKKIEKKSAASTTKTRRSRRGGKKSESAEKVEAKVETAAEPVVEAPAEAPAAEKKAAE